MAQKFDLSGVYRFWEIVDIFKDGKEPDEDKWEGLFDTPGYDILTEIEFPEEYLKGVFGSAFRGDKRDISKDKEGVEDQMIEHLKEVRDNREELNTFLSRIYAEDFYDEALDIAFGWLPFEEKEPYPPVSFLVFQNDARGYIPIVFDLQFAYELADDFPVFLAHEMHHFYRNLDVSFDPDIEDKEIVWAVNQIHMEGIADHINRDLIFGDTPVMGDDYKRRYIEVYQHAQIYIEELDRYIRRYDEDPDKYGHKIRDTLPLSGNPIGFFMAETVIDSGFKDELIEGYDEPFSFFELYNSSAEKQDKLKFSEDSLEVLNYLNKKYS